MKLISVLIPCYNEVDNVGPISEAVVAEFSANLPQYDYEIVFIDNCSVDGTREKLENICANNNKIKAIFNAKNFGQLRSPCYGLTQTNGDCTICLCCDFQDPIEMIHKFVAEWENGYKIVIGIKTKSKENKFMRFIRTCYYKLIKKMSSVEQIEHFTGFGLYDRSFIKVLQDLDDPIPFLRGIVAELGFARKEIEYTQARRAAGHTHNNFYSLYDIAMVSFTSYTKVGLRIVTFLGFIIALCSFLVAGGYFVAKLIWWDKFPMGMVPMVCGIFFMGAVQLFTIGLVGEYVMSINTRVMHRPLVIEEKRINF